MDSINFELYINTIITSTTQSHTDGSKLLPNQPEEYFCTTREKALAYARLTTGEAKFPECHMLLRVPKLGHSGKVGFPECH
jgi:hypothetical protein